MVHQAVERNIEIISEASRRLPEDLKQGEKKISWKKIAGVGNVLRQDYREINHKSLWMTIQEDLTPMKEAVERMRESIEKLS